jgi:hypothetical protein
MFNFILNPIRDGVYWVIGKILIGFLYIVFKGILRWKDPIYVDIPEDELRTILKKIIPFIESSTMTHIFPERPGNEPLDTEYIEMKNFYNAATAEDTQIIIRGHIVHNHIKTGSTYIHIEIMEREELLPMLLGHKALPGKAISLDHCVTNRLKLEQEMQSDISQLWWLAYWYNDKIIGRINKGTV